MTVGFGKMRLIVKPGSAFSQKGGTVPAHCQASPKLPMHE